MTISMKPLSMSLVARMRCTAQPPQPVFTVPPTGPALSPWLYHWLDTSLPGGVAHVISPGRRIERVCWYNNRTWEPMSKITAWGEIYVANCPYCDDRTGQLRVSHAYGLLDEHGKDNLHLVWCQNRQCLKSTDNKRRLAEMIFGDTLARLHEVRTARLMAPAPADDTIAVTGEAAPLVGRPSTTPLMPSTLSRQ
jgi:hypothetical protein